LVWSLTKQLLNVESHWHTTWALDWTFVCQWFQHWTMSTLWFGGSTC